eukprot:363411-Chlamydomonas_euryale.AAC.8
MARARAMLSFGDVHKDGWAWHVTRVLWLACAASEPCPQQRPVHTPPSATHKKQHMGTRTPTARLSRPGRQCLKLEERRWRLRTRCYGRSWWLSALPAHCIGGACLGGSAWSWRSGDGGPSSGDDDGGGEAEGGCGCDGAGGWARVRGRRPSTWGWRSHGGDGCSGVNVVSAGGALIRGCAAGLRQSW